MFSNEYGSHLIQTDAEGNLYYIGNWIIYKLDIRDPGNITREQLTMETIPGEDASVVSDDDVVTFHAMSMSGSNIIIGEISPDGMITVHEKSGTEPIQLIKLQ